MRIIAPPLILHANRSTLMFICNDKKPINIRAYKMRTNGLCSIEVGMINYNVMYLLCLIQRIHTYIEGVSGSSYINTNNRSHLLHAQPCWGINI